MVTHVTRGGIIEFIRLAAETFETTPDTAEYAIRQLLVQWLKAGRDAGADCLLDYVPGARDLAFAELLARATIADAGVVPGIDGTDGVDGVDDIRDAADEDPVRAVLATADLFALYLSYCSAHAGADCTSRLLAAACRIGPATAR